MEWEQLAACELGLDWTVELWSEDVVSDHQCHRTFLQPYTGLLGRRLFLHQRLRKVCDEYDAIIVRHAPLDFFAPLLPTRVKRKCWYAFHTRTNEYLLKLGAFKGRFVAILDRFLTRQATSGIRGVIAMTSEIAQEEIRRAALQMESVIIAPNGIYKAEWETFPVDRRDGPLKIIFIASHFFEWNGLERLMNSLAGEVREHNWQLHFVGELTDAQQHMIESSGFNDRIYTHGSVGSGKIELLLTEMDLSLGAFALDALSMQEACTLKVRESLGAGVPVYSGHRDAGLPSSFEYYIKGAPNFPDIVEVAARMRKEARVSVISKSREFVDKKFLIERLYGAIGDLVG
jgi:glycosyltransferase involved in cell wall biosynthesis